MSLLPDPQVGRNIPDDYKDIVKKAPKEGVAAFIARGLARGVQRQCVHCTAKRAFDLIHCPVCRRIDFIQVQGPPPAKATPSEADLKKEAKEAPPNVPGGYSFTPNPAHDPNADRPVQSPGATPDVQEPAESSPDAEGEGAQASAEGDDGEGPDSTA